MHRCTELKTLDDTSLKLCLKAAGYKLLYAGTTGGGAAAAGGPATGTEAGQAQESLKDGQQAASKGNAGQAHDLESLHTAYQRTQNKVENMLSRTAVSEGSWSFAEQALLVIALLGVGVFGYNKYKAYQLGRSKDHRSE